MSMILTEAQFTDLRSQFSTYRTVEKAEGRPYPNADDFEEIAARAMLYGVLGGFIQSAWVRAAHESQEAGAIRLNKPAAVPQQIPADFPAQINAMTSTQLRVKLNRDAAFATIYGRWAAGEQPEGTVANQDYELTLSQWRSLPPTVAARKMSDPKFRAAVDRLIARGEI